MATVLGGYVVGLAPGNRIFGRMADRPGTKGLRPYAFIIPALMNRSGDIHRTA